MSGQSLSASCWSGQGSWEGARLSEDLLHTNKNTHTHTHSEMWMYADARIWTCTTTCVWPIPALTRHINTHASGFNTNTNAHKFCIPVCNDKHIKQCCGKHSCDIDIQGDDQMRIRAEGDLRMRHHVSSRRDGDGGLIP